MQKEETQQIKHKKIEKQFNIIYKTTHTKTGRYYIGLHSTNNLSDNYMGSGNWIKLAKPKYGRAAFTVEILEYTKTRAELAELEKQYVTSETLKDPLCKNMRTGGCFEYSKIPTKETNKKISESLHKLYASPEGSILRKKLSLSHKTRFNGLTGNNLRYTLSITAKSFWDDADRSKEARAKLAILHEKQRTNEEYITNSQNRMIEFHKQLRENGEWEKIERITKTAGKSNIGRKRSEESIRKSKEGYKKHFEEFGRAPVTEETKAKLRISGKNVASWWKFTDVTTNEIVYIKNLREWLIQNNCTANKDRTTIIIKSSHLYSTNIPFPFYLCEKLKTPPPDVIAGLSEYQKVRLAKAQKQIILNIELGVKCPGYVRSEETKAKLKLTGKSSWDNNNRKLITNEDRKNNSSKIWIITNIKTNEVIEIKNLKSWLVENNLMLHPNYIIKAKGPREHPKKVKPILYTIQHKYNIK